MRSGKAWMAAALLAALALRPGAALAEGPKIAVMDVNRVINDSEAGKAAKAKAEARFLELKKQVDAKQEEAKKLKEEIDKQKVLLGKEKLKEKEDRFNAKVAELQQLASKSEKEMQTKQRELERDVLKLVEAEVEKVVKEEKIDLLFDKAAVVHVVPSLDITGKVLERVNGGSPQGTTGGK